MAERSNRTAVKDPALFSQIAPWSLGLSQGQVHLRSLRGVLTLDFQDGMN